MSTKPNTEKSGINVDYEETWPEAAERAWWEGNPNGTQADYDLFLANVGRAFKLAMGTGE